MRTWRLTTTTERPEGWTPEDVVEAHVERLHEEGLEYLGARHDRVGLAGHLRVSLRFRATEAQALAALDEARRGGRATLDRLDGRKYTRLPA